MIKNPLIAKGSVKRVGRIYRDDQTNEYIKHEIKAGYTFDPQNPLAGNALEYTGKEYEDDLLTDGYIWNDVLQIHEEKSVSYYLEQAKTKKKLELKKEALSRAQLIYPDITIGAIKLIEDLFLTVKANARDPLSGDLLTLKNIKDTRSAKAAEIDALTTIGEVEAYNIGAGW